MSLMDGVAVLSGLRADQYNQHPKDRNIPDLYVPGNQQQLTGL